MANTDPLHPLARSNGVMTFGVLIPHFGAHATRERVIQGSARVEQLGFDAVWVRDHLLWTPHEHEGTDITFVEPLEALSAIAAVTERIFLGTAVLIPLRWPLKLAQDLAALSWLAGGRVIGGLGTGHKQAEMRACGFDAAQRREILAETVEILRKIWSEDVSNHDGPMFPYQDIRIEPKPVAPIPLWYGGTTRLSARVAAASYDGWMPGGAPFATLRDRIQILRDLTAENGRRVSISTVPRLRIHRDRNVARANNPIQALSSGSEGAKHWIVPEGGFNTVDDLKGIMVVGEPEEVAEQVLEFVELGVDHFVFDLRGQFDMYEESLDLLAEYVLPLVRRELGSRVDGA